MNCWIWIILLKCICGNGFNNMGCCGCHNHCECHNHCDNNYPIQTLPSYPSNNDCGCNNDLIQPRGFAGFGDNSTCGCEDKGNK